MYGLWILALVKVYRFSGLAGGVDSFQNLGNNQSLLGQYNGIGIVYDAVDPVDGFGLSGAHGNALVEVNAYHKYDKLQLKVTFFSYLCNSGTDRRF